MLVSGLARSGSRSPKPQDAGCRQAGGEPRSPLRDGNLAVCSRGVGHLREPRVQRQPAAAAGHLDAAGRHCTRRVAPRQFEHRMTLANHTF